MFLLSGAEFAFLWFAFLVGVEGGQFLGEVNEVLHLFPRNRRLFGGSAVNVVGHLVVVPLRGEHDTAGPSPHGVGQQVVRRAVAEEHGRAGLGGGDFVVVGGDEQEALHRLQFVRLGDDMFDVLDREDPVEVEHPRVAMSNVRQTSPSDGKDEDEQPDHEDRNQPPEQDAQSADPDKCANPGPDAGVDRLGVLVGPRHQRKPKEIEDEKDRQLDDGDVATVLDRHQKGIWHEMLRSHRVMTTRQTAHEALAS